LCPRECTVPPGGRGHCEVRENRGGTYYTLTYGNPCAVHVDPIEKKPFYHFMPGATAYSLLTSGCPLRCKFCQNWQISQASPEDYDSPFTLPATVADVADSRGAPVLAFTYNEPTVFTEYLLDIAAEARKRKMRSVAVSCGFMNAAPLADMCKALDAIKVDLKGYTEEFYRDVCGASLGPVLRSIQQIAKSGVHLEIVNLVVPTLNDSDASLQGLAGWVARELGRDVPLHFSRFYPNYQMQNLPPTPVATLTRARDIALAKGLRYVYVGNADHEGNHTYCPACRKLVIQRIGFFVTRMYVDNGRCRFCGRPIAGVWS
ncbi:MAG: AmmeMemoRadiSam system radical SAM enzyme, partial [Acidobacteria bacterium]